MSDLEKQLKEIQRKIEKVKLYRKVIENLKKETDEVEGHPGLVAEMVDDLTKFCVARIVQIERPKSAPPITPEPSEGEIVKKRANKPDPMKAALEKAQATDEDGEPLDPLMFMKKYRHLDGKEVTVKTKNGDVKAIVRGMTVPFILVETVTGHNVQVKPKDLIV